MVDDFGVKYLEKCHGLRLKSALKKKYRVTTDWEEKFYIGIELKWDYEKVMVQLPMTGYVRVALYAF